MLTWNIWSVWDSAMPQLRKNTAVPDTNRAVQESHKGHRTGGTKEPFKTTAIAPLTPTLVVPANSLLVILGREFLTFIILYVVVHPQLRFIVGHQSGNALKGQRHRPQPAVLLIGSLNAWNSPRI
jgi:hypothetical protein